MNWFQSLGKTKRQSKSNAKEVLKTLFNIVEAPFKKKLNIDISGLYDDVQMD